jgi:hypothetical protein
VGWLSAAHFDEGLELRGPELVMPGGYSAVVRALEARLRPLGCVRVELNAPVNAVRVAGGGGEAGGGSTRRATVSLHDGRSFTCHAVIVTVPIGVLQASVGGACAAPGPVATPAAEAAARSCQSRIAFEPPLPAALVTAVRALGAGTLNKTIVEFEGPAAERAFQVRACAGSRLYRACAGALASQFGGHVFVLSHFVVRELGVLARALACCAELACARCPAIMHWCVR